ncbi:MAG: ABC transporter ATP-binding protein [bacterium]
MNLLKKSLFPYLLQYILAAVFLIFTVLITVALPKLSGDVIDQVNTGKFAQGTIVLIGILVASAFLFDYAQAVLSAWVAEQVAYNLRLQVVDKVLGQTYQYVLQTTPAKLLTVLTNDIVNIRRAIAQNLLQVVSSVFLLLGSVVIMLSINAKLAGILFLLIPLLVLVFVGIFKKLIVLFQKTQLALDKVNRTIDENIKAASLVRVFVAKTMEIAKFFKNNEELRDIGTQIVLNFAILFPLVLLIVNGGMVLIFWFGGTDVIQGNLTIGELSAFYFLLLLFLFPIIRLGFISGEIGRAVTSAKRVDEVLKSEVTFVDGVEPLTSFTSLELRDVVYKDVLKKVNFTVSKGETVAIIGPTGSGKSLLLHVLLRFLDPDSGTVLLNGKPIHEFSIHDLRAKMSFVLQENILFGGSILENIAFGNPQATKDDVIHVAKIAEAHDFISGFTKRYDEVIGERGVTLSGGQKQRLTLARALLIKPEVLILDDATARLDILTEQRIISNIKRELPNLTLINVAQKVASIRDATRIYVMEDGEMIASGTHEELLVSNFSYQQITLSQQQHHD